MEKKGELTEVDGFEIKKMPPGGGGVEGAGGNKRGRCSWAL